ncbi:MAG: type II toxin-antitoxin system VapC family toxin [Oscillospiraceae bacterium]|nr:type II toxin-antitoxin system VapC family toxin [Oscillospiraceae bacterium]
MSYFLDTNICIYFLKRAYGNIHHRVLTTKPSNIKIPAIVKAELIYGAEKSLKRDENMTKLIEFLHPFDIISFDDDCSIYYGKIRAELEKSGTPIGPNDLFIAATVLSYNGILVTNNVREFSRILELNIENWLDP